MRIDKIFDKLFIDLTRVESLQAFIKEHPCPKCQQNQMKVLNYEIGQQGWETQIRCSKCHSQGIFNNTGFHFKIYNGEKTK